MEALFVSADPWFGELWGRWRVVIRLPLRWALRRFVRAAALWMLLWLLLLR
jgi:hypothetical protein